MSAASSTRCPTDASSSLNIPRKSSSSSTIRTQTPILLILSERNDPSKAIVNTEWSTTSRCSTEYTKCCEPERFDGLLALKVTALGRLLNAISLAGKRTRQLLIGATLGLTAAICLSASSTGAYFAASDWVSHTLEVQRDLDQWMVALLDAQARARDVLISGEGADWGAYNTALEKERASALRVRRSVRDNPSQLMRVDTTDRSARAVVETLRALVAPGSEEHRQERIRLSALQPNQRPMAAFRADWQKVRDEEENLLAQRHAMSR